MSFQPYDEPCRRHRHRAAAAGVGDYRLQHQPMIQPILITSAGRCGRPAVKPALPRFTRSRAKDGRTGRSRANSVSIAARSSYGWRLIRPSRYPLNLPEIGMIAAFPALIRCGDQRARPSTLRYVRWRKRATPIAPARSRSGSIASQ